MSDKGHKKDKEEKKKEDKEEKKNKEDKKVDGSKSPVFKLSLDEKKKEDSKPAREPVHEPSSSPPASPRSLDGLQLSPRTHDPNAQPAKGILVKPGSKRKSIVAHHVEVVPASEQGQTPELEKHVKKTGEDHAVEGRFGLIKKKSLSSLHRAPDEHESPRDPTIERRMIRRKSSGEDELKAVVEKKD